MDVTNPKEWKSELFHHLGELMGKMHTHTRPYVKKIGVNKQLDWKHSYLFWPENTKWVDPDIQPFWDSTLSEMEALPQAENDYGIVHTDIHHLNFHFEAGHIVLFDFDDCEYSWYAYDLASTLFFMASTADYRDAESGKNMLKQFSVPFLQGYRSHAELPGHWGEMFSLFLRYRRLAQYKYFFSLFYGQANPHEEYLAWVKEDILNGSRYLAWDFQL